VTEQALQEVTLTGLSRYEDNVKEFNSISRSLATVTDLEAYWSRVRRLKQLNDELEAMP
jgi:hypothetical protein